MRKVVPSEGVPLGVVASMWSEKDSPFDTYFNINQINFGLEGNAAEGKRKKQ